MNIENILGRLEHSTEKNPTLIKPRAFCTSIKCAGDSASKIGAEKLVSIRTIDCPDCGNALYWTKIQRDITLADNKK